LTDDRQILVPAAPHHAHHRGELTAELACARRVSARDVVSCMGPRAASGDDTSTTQRRNS
jgi:hypothetical protein